MAKVESNMLECSEQSATLPPKSAWIETNCAELRDEICSKSGAPSGPVDTCRLPMSEEESDLCQCVEAMELREAGPDVPCRKVCFEGLPEEIKLKIFALFTVEELCSTVSPVCRQWYRLAHDQTLWQKMSFVSDELTPLPVVLMLISQAPLLRELSLQSREDADSILYEVGESCPQLQSLSVRFSDGLNEGVVTRLAQKCPDIMHLNVEGSRLVGDGCCRAIAQFSHLRRLNLSHCLSLNGASLLAIAKGCPCLEDLNVDGIPRIWDAEMRAVVQERHGEFRKLVLDGEDLTDATFSSLAQCQDLLVLGISFADLMTDKGLLTGIGALPSLHWLRIKRGLELSSMALECLFANPQNVSRLVHLDLSECSNLNDSSVENVAANCPLLTYLALCWCWDVTDLGVEHIIRGCRFLTTLDMIGVVRITGACFHLIPTHLPYLEYLDLEQCGNIEDSVLEQVIVMQPKLKIIDYYGDQVVPDQNKLAEASQPELLSSSADGDDETPLKLKVYLLRNGY